MSRYNFIIKKDAVSIEDLILLFDSGFKWAKKVNRVPLFRGLQFGYMILPVIASETPPSQEVLDYIYRGARKHFSLFEFPVVIDLQSGEAHYKALFHFLHFPLTDLSENRLPSCLKD